MTLKLQFRLWSDELLPDQFPSVLVSCLDIRLYAIDSAPGRTNLRPRYSVNVNGGTSCGQTRHGRLDQTGRPLYPDHKISAQHSWAAHPNRIPAWPPYANHSTLQLCHSMEMVNPGRPAQRPLIKPLDDRWCPAGQQWSSPVPSVSSIGRHHHCHNRGRHGSWKSQWCVTHPSRIQNISHLSSTSGLMILSQQVILNFGHMDQRWRYRPQESPDRFSYVAYHLVLFDFQRRPPTTCP